MHSKLGGLRGITLGPMFGGKSTKLVNSISIWAHAPFHEKVLYINHLSDNRSTTHTSSTFSTHNKCLNKIPEGINQVKCHRLSEVSVRDFNVIGIDEFQLYDGNPAKTVRDWVINQNKNVYIASLDGDFQLEPFGEIYSLIPLCQSGGLTKLGSICITCYQKGQHSVASFTQRTSSTEEKIEIGGADKYIPVCLDCYLKGQKARYR